MERLKTFWKDEQGLEVVEYAIIAGMIVVASLVAITSIGIWVVAQFNAIEAGLANGP